MLARTRLHRVAREVGSATRITLGPSSLRSSDVLAVQAELARAERGTVNTGVLHAGRSSGSNVRDLAQATAVERAKHFQIVANLMRTLGLSKLPTIAVLDGQATGIALGIGAHASACVVTERTRLSLPGPAFGFVPESFASSARTCRSQAHRSRGPSSSSSASPPMRPNRRRCIASRQRCAARPPDALPLAPLDPSRD